MSPQMDDIGVTRDSADGSISSNINGLDATGGIDLSLASSLCNDDDDCVDGKLRRALVRTSLEASSDSGQRFRPRFLLPDRRLSPVSWASVNAS